MEIVKEIEELLDKRTKEICLKCWQFYYMSDLRVSVPEELEGTEEDGKLLSEYDEPFWFMESMARDEFFYDLRNRLYGLAEFLHKDDEGFDKNEVPLITYEITRENKLLVTCYVDKEFLKDHADTPKKLLEFLNGQISEGWGENGFIVARFGGDTKMVISDGVDWVEAKVDPNTYKEYWEKVN